MWIQLLLCCRCDANRESKACPQSGDVSCRQFPAPATDVMNEPSTLSSWAGHISDLPCCRSSCHGNRPLVYSCIILYTIFIWPPAEFIQRIGNVLHVFFLLVPHARRRIPTDFRNALLQDRTYLRNVAVLNF